MTDIERAAKAIGSLLASIRRNAPPALALAIIADAREVTALPASPVEGAREEFTRRALKFVAAYKAYADAIGNGLPRKGTEVVWADKEQHAKCIDLLISHDALLAAEAADRAKGIP